MRMYFYVKNFDEPSNVGYCLIYQYLAIMVISYILTVLSDMLFNASAALMKYALPFQNVSKIILHSREPPPRRKRIRTGLAASLH